MVRIYVTLGPKSVWWGWNKPAKWRHSVAVSGAAPQVQVHEINTIIRATICLPLVFKTFKPWGMAYSPPAGAFWAGLQGTHGTIFDHM